MRRFGFVLSLAGLVSLLAACSAGGVDVDSDGPAGAKAGAAGTGGAGSVTPGTCGSCDDLTYTDCSSGTAVKTMCPTGCTAMVGCTACSAGAKSCIDGQPHDCNPDGTVGAAGDLCDSANGMTCNAGLCTSACALAAGEPSNVGCEFWAADLDMSDITAVASHPWGLVIANAGTVPANVTIEENDAPQGMPISLSTVNMGTLAPGQLGVLMPPIRILDCGGMPDNHNAPGTCLSSNALRVTSTAPVVVYQFNNISHDYSTDASLLLPTPSLGSQYRVMGWPSGHPETGTGIWVERTYITVIGTQENTQVTVTPTWRIHGNAPIAAGPIGQPITVTIGPFDVLNLESDDSTIKECLSMTSPLCSDLTGSSVVASAPVVVFSGTESSGVGLPEGAPLSPSCMPDPSTGMPESDDCGCCLQHFEEQLAPLESLGKKYVVTRSPIRSTGDSGYIEPDVLRFLGAAEPANVTTTLPPPFDSFTLQPGEIKDTWTQTDIIVTADVPIIIGQFMIAGGYIDPDPVADPSFTIFPPVEQAQTNYVFLSPDGWGAWVVISAPVGTDVTVDGAEPTGCVVAQAGMLDGTMYEARRCQLPSGAHSLVGSAPFGIMAYGFADADSYSFPGGAFFKKIYTPPMIH